MLLPRLSRGKRWEERGATKHHVSNKDLHCKCIVSIQKELQHHHCQKDLPLEALAGSYYSGLSEHSILRGLVSPVPTAFDKIFQQFLHPHPSGRESEQ